MHAPCRQDNTLPNHNIRTLDESSWAEIDSNSLVLSITEVSSSMIRPFIHSHSAASVTALSFQAASPLSESESSLVCLTGAER
jgi:hypothetical protein